MHATLTVDILHVVSDFHLGGRSGFQIFRAGSKFNLLVNAIATEAQETKVGLVMNGDFVDFLAEQPAVYFDPLQATQKLRRILSDPAFTPVTEGLRRLLAMPNVSVAIALGNHDIELALPWVAEELTNLLAGSDRDARARLTLETAGYGISACVGKAKVLCLHGNEFDEWNVTNYEALRKAIRSLRRGASSEIFQANAGTKLVVDVMNSIKEQYPFVDLLKPETGAVLPLLLALDPSMVRRIPDAAETIPQLVRDTMLWRTGYLGSADAGSASPTGPDALRESITAQERADFAALLLDRAEENLREGIDALALAQAEPGSDLLGMGTALWKLVARAPTAEVLREAIDYLDTDRSFDRTMLDTTFRRADLEVPADVDVVVTGHTHLERVLRRRNGRGWYFNSGTWASLMQIAPSLRGDPTAFKAFLQKLKGQNLDSLDADRLLISRPAVVSIWSKGEHAFAQLRHLRHAANASEPFEAVAGDPIQVG